MSLFDHHWSPVRDGRLDLEALAEPLEWGGGRVWVGELFDLVLEDSALPAAAVFGVMAVSQQCRFVVATENVERMASWFNSRHGLESTEETAAREGAHHAKIIWDARGTESHEYMDWAPGARCDNRRPWPGFPLPNVTLAAHVRTQAEAEERIPALLECPARWRMVVCEPRQRLDLGLSGVLPKEISPAYQPLSCAIDGVIVRGGSEPMHPDHARSIRDQCAEAGVPFAFEGWGEWVDAEKHFDASNWTVAEVAALPADSRNYQTLIGSTFYRVGADRSGRLLDGSTHDDLPEDS